MSEDNGNGDGKKNGKKIVDWKGIATLVTAIGGVLGMFLIQDKKGNESEMVQESAFVVVSARIDKLEERIMHIERMLMREAAGAHMMDTVKSPECHEDDDCGEGSICEENICRPEPTPGEDGDGDGIEDPIYPEPASPMVKKRDKVIEKFRDFKEIKEHVQVEQMPVRF